MFWRKGCVAVAAIVASTREVLAQNAMLYSPSVDSISLTSENSNGKDIKTLFTEEAVVVTAAISWAPLVNASSVNSTGIVEWETFVGGVSVASGSYNASSDSTLPSSLEVGSNITVSEAGATEFVVVLKCNEKESEGSLELQTIAPGVSLVPLFVILFMAISTQMVELSLGLGVFIGAWIVSGSFVVGFKDTLEKYILGAVADGDHAYVYLFSLFLGGLVAMMEKAGGISGLTTFLVKFAKTSRSGQFAAFCSGILIFFDDYANCLVVGSTMKPVLDSLSVSREKLAFIVDATAAPIASLVPVSSWVGYEVELIDAELEAIFNLKDGPSTAELPKTGLGVFLDSIAYRYYPFFMLFLQLLLILLKRDMGPMLIAERRTQVYRRVDGGKGAFKGAEHMKSGNEPEKDTPARWWNMIVPVVFLIFFIFFMLVQTGIKDGVDQDFLDIIQSANSFTALLVGTMAGALTTLGFYMVQFKRDGEFALPSIRGIFPGLNKDGNYSKPLMNPSEAMKSFLFGLGRVFPALIVLTLAWASSAIMGSIGANRLFAKWIISSGLAASNLPTIAFMLSFLMALATGTSWGTMAIVFPLVTVPTWIASNGSIVVFNAVVGSVLAGAVAGDHVSPISDTTVLSSLATECDLLAHVKTQAPYVFIAVVWSILLGTLPVGRENYSTGVGILLGFIFCALTVVLLCSSIIHSTGRYDPLTELYLKITKNEDLQKLKEDTAQAAATNGPVRPDGDEESSIGSMEKAATEI